MNASERTFNYSVGPGCVSLGLAASRTMCPIKKCLSDGPWGQLRAKRASGCIHFIEQFGLFCCLDPTSALHTYDVWMSTGSSIPNDARLGHPMVRQQLLACPQKVARGGAVLTRCIFEMTCCLKSHFKSIQIC